MGKIEIDKIHPWSDGLNGFQISPYLQELQVYGGQSDNYTASAADLEKFLRIKVSRSQMERLTKYYSEELSDEHTDLSLEQAQREQVSVLTKQAADSGGTIYAMADGSMLPTREGDKHNDWKEVKLGRIFLEEDKYELDQHHNWIRQSVYSAKLGTHNSFIEQFEPLTDIASKINENLVFICDGASWIWNWVQDCYPRATQILDFYHAVEYLGKLSAELFKEKPPRTQWLAAQKLLLLNDGVDQVIDNIENLDAGSKRTQEVQASTLTYFNNNKHRMLYKTYRDRGLNIGSGAIESAHRVVLQKRLKQSGQRWTIDGAQKIINLRVLNLNGQWNTVVKKIKADEQVRYAQSA